MAEKQITPKKGVVVSEINGVKYFKLQSPYPGDYTKNCGLLGNEIDENFFFLRSYDIEDMYVDENGILVLTRVDGSTLTADINRDEKYHFDFNRKTGELTITFPDGTIEVLGGFLVAGEVKIATNETLKGDGSVMNPLGMSEVEVTGTYAPAHKLLDMTQYDYFHKVEVGEDDRHHGHDKHHDKDEHHRPNKYIYTPINVDEIPEGEKVLTFSVIPCVVKENSPEYIRVWHRVDLPKKHVGKGYRVVTKEFVDTFGLLYNFEGVKKIKEALEATGSQWRVPSREDWAELLNAAEYCDENRNHDTECVNEWTGKDAGARAKSLHFWKKSHDEEHGIPVHGEDNLPATGGQQTFRVFPVGYGEGSRGAHDFDHDVEALHKLASYWTSTEVGCGSGSGQSNVYTRTFAYDTRKVLQESSKPSSRLSLRLVRDYDYKNMGVREVEKILGHDVPVTLITNEDTDYSKVWTVVNISFSEPQYGGVSSFQWNDDEFPEYYKKEVYYINEFDGEKWVKKAMREGDSIVLIDGGFNEDGEMIYNHEWRIYREGCKLYLVDTIDALRNEIKKDLQALQDEIDNIEKNVGLDEDGNFNANQDNEYTSGATTITDAIDSLDENLKRVDDKVQKFQIQEVPELKSESSQTAYALTLGDDVAIGDVIQIPNDKVIKHIYTGYTDGFEIDIETGEVVSRGSGDTEAIYFVYLDEFGKYSLSEPLEIEDILYEDEFKDGLIVEEHIVKVNIDNESDKDYHDEYFLTVSENGVKLSGVKKIFNGLKDSLGINETELENGKVDFNKPTYVEVPVEELTPTEIRGASPMDEVLSDEELSEKYINGEEIPEYIVVDVTNEDGETEPHYYKLTPKTNYISDETDTVSAIVKLDESLKNEESARIEEDERLSDKIERVEEKLDEEIERAKAAEEQLQKNIDEEAAARKEMDDYLYGQDIIEEDYVLGINGLDLNRKNGQERIHIEFDANFGTIDDIL